MNTITTIYLEPPDHIRCQSVRLPDAGQSWECLWLGDMRIFASDDQLEAIRGAIELRLHAKFSQRKPALDPFVARWGAEVDREMTESLDLYPDHTVATIDPDELLANMAEPYEVHREV